METKVTQIDPKSFKDEDFAEAVALMKKGNVVAFPTETVYGLGADATSETATAAIFAAKKRPMDNPLICHVDSIEMITRFLADEIPPSVLPLLKAMWPGPLTILLKKKEGNAVPNTVTAGQPTVAVRMPSHPIALRLIHLLGRPIAAPSANLSGRPSPTKAEHVHTDLVDRIPLIIDGGSSSFGVESTVIDAFRDPPLILRPGGATLEQLRVHLPTIQVYSKEHYLKAADEEDLEEKPPTPGLKYRHYSPKASVILFEGSSNQQKTYIIPFVKSLVAAGKKVGILHTQGNAIEYPAEISSSCVLLSLGTDSLLIASSLFASLRELDDKHHVDLIVMEGIDSSHFGLAVMNRIRKASSTIIDCASPSPSLPSPSSFSAPSATPSLV